MRVWVVTKCPAWQDVNEFDQVVLVTADEEKARTRCGEVSGDSCEDGMYIGQVSGPFEVQ